MARLWIGQTRLEFPLEDPQGRVLAAAVLDASQRHEEARLLREAITDVTEGEIVHMIAGWRLRISVRRARLGPHRDAMVELLPPRNTPTLAGYRGSASEAAGDGCDAAILWLCLAAVSTQSVRMGPSLFLYWFSTLRFKRQTSEIRRNKPVHVKRQGWQDLFIRLAGLTEGHEE